MSIETMPEVEQAVPVEKKRKPLFSIGKTIKPPGRHGVLASAVVISRGRHPGARRSRDRRPTSRDTSDAHVIADIGTSIHRGTGFAEAVARSPRSLPPYYRAMLASAEYTGNLDDVLSQLAAYMERDIAARRQVKSALTYPIMVLVIAIAAMIVMSVFVLPKFSGLYRGLGARLPLPTRMLMGFTHFMTSYWPFILLTIVLIMGAVVAVMGGARGKSRRDVAGDEVAGDRQPLPTHLARAVLPGAVVALIWPGCRCHSRSACRPTARTTRSSKRTW